MEKFDLVQFSDIEGKSALEKLTGFLSENSMDIRIQSAIGQDNKLEVKIILLKKVPSTPVIEVVPPTLETPVIDAVTVSAELGQPEA